MAFHMDLSIEIAWILVQRVPWGVNVIIQSGLVILVELAILTVMCLLMNRFTPFLYQYRKLYFTRK